MAFVYIDPNPAAPFATFQIKDVVCKAFKLTYANFGTTAVNTNVGILPADASIIRVTTWVKTALSGNSVSSPTISLGSASAGTQFTNALAITNTTGTYAVASPITGIMQAYEVPLGSDIPLWVSGGCSTGNPTAGEIYLLVEYIR